MNLTDSELRAERDSTTAVKATGLWADWPMADNTDTGDDSGNGRDLTFGGTLTTETGPSLETTISKSDSANLGESRSVVMGDGGVTKTEGVDLGESRAVVMGDGIVSNTEGLNLAESYSL